MRAREWVRDPGESWLRPTETPRASLTFKGLAEEEEFPKEIEKKREVGDKVEEHPVRETRRGSVSTTKYYKDCNNYV